MLSSIEYLLCAGLSAKHFTYSFYLHKNPEVGIIIIISIFQMKTLRVKSFAPSHNGRDLRTDLADNKIHIRLSTY